MQMAASKILAHSITLFNVSLVLDLLMMVVTAADFSFSPPPLPDAGVLAVTCKYRSPPARFLPSLCTDSPRGDGENWVCLSTAMMALEFSGSLSSDATGEAYGGDPASDRSGEWGESWYSVDSEFRDEDLFMEVLKCCCCCLLW